MTSTVAELPERDARVSAVRKRKRLLFLTITFHPEPGAMRGLPLAKRLVQSGAYDVTVLTAVPWYPLGRTYPGYRQRPWQWEEIEGVRVLRLPIYPSHDSSAIRRALTYLSFMVAALVVGLPLVGRADVVFHLDNLPTTGLVALFYGWIRGVPVIQHVGDMWPESVIESGILPRGVVGRWAGAVLRKVCDFVYRRNVLITVLSPGFKRILVDRRVQPDRVEVVYNWAEEDYFSPASRDEALAVRLGFAGKFNVVYAGNIGPLQALETVVRAAHLLRDEPRVQIVVVGEGPRLSQVTALAREFQLSNMRFLGRMPIEQMNALNAISDVLLVHLADREFLHSTIPSKVQVALASARPILLGVRGDGADLVAKAGAGLAFTPEDPADLARCVRRIAGFSPTELERMGSSGRAYYEQRLSLDIGVRRMREILDAAASGSALPA